MKTEVIPYTMVNQGEMDRVLSEKLELDEQRRNGLIIRVYWLRLTNEVSLQLTNDSEMYETIIPNDRVTDAREHPYAYLAQSFPQPLDPRARR